MTSFQLNPPPVFIWMPREAGEQAGDLLLGDDGRLLPVLMGLATVAGSAFGWPVRLLKEASRARPRPCLFHGAMPSSNDMSSAPAPIFF